MVSVMREFGAEGSTAGKGFVFAAALSVFSALWMIGCAPEPPPPDLNLREPFARSVVAAATSGSVEQVERLAPDDFVNVRSEAQRLVDAMNAWDPASVDVRISNDFAEVAHVQALVPGGTAHVEYVISWSHERWALLIGTSSHLATGGAKPGIAGDESHLKSKIPK